MPDKGPLYHFLPDQVNPPQALWNQLAKALDETEMAGSLSQLNSVEQLPPAEVWSNLEQRLDAAERVAAFSAGPELAAQEVEPPLSVWQNIRQELDRSEVIQIPPAKSNTRRILQVVAAAACIGGIIMFTSFFIKNNQAKTIAGNMPARIWPVMVGADSQGITHALWKNPKKPDNPDKNQVAFPPSTVNFIHAVGLNGNTVKVSPKLGPMIEFFSNRVDQAQLAPQKKIWLQRLSDWKSALNSPATSAASVNFADPIDLIRFLQKKK